MAKTIQFYDIDTIALAGPHTIAQPLIIGRMTEYGQKMRRKLMQIGELGVPHLLANPDILTMIPATRLLTDVINFEMRHFGKLISERDSDSKDNYHLTITPCVPGRVLTPGWHMDGDYKDGWGNIYLFGGPDQRFNAEYALQDNIPPELRPLMHESNEHSNESSQDIQLQQRLTEYFKANGGIAQIGANEIAIVTKTTPHRSSEHHAERTKDYPFMRLAIARDCLTR